MLIQQSNSKPSFGNNENFGFRILLNSGVGLAGKFVIDFIVTLTNFDGKEGSCTIDCTERNTGFERNIRRAI